MTEKKENFRMTAEELANFFDIHKDDQVLTQIFEMEYTFQSIMERYGAEEVVKRIQEWRDRNGRYCSDSTRTLAVGLRENMIQELEPASRSEL